jgi:uncharacterized protein (UPF0248 family)
MHPLRNVFKKITWDTRERAGNYIVYFIHRGAPEDTREINASVITKVGPSWFTYSAAESEETLIPFHRVRRIVNVQTGQAVWVSRARRSAKDPG